MEVEACLILRFVSLRFEGQLEEEGERENDGPVEIGSFDVAESFRLAGAENDEVGGEEVV